MSVCLHREKDYRLNLKTSLMKIASKKSLKAILATIMIASSSLAFAEGSFSVGSDVVSSYVWRGYKQVDNSPNVQPYLSFSTGALTIGSWGSVNFPGTLKEFDLYATYAISDALALTITDYNWTFTPGTSYFKYGTGTDHIFEATLAYAGSETLPLSATLNTMFAGNDKKLNGDQALSTYLELGYQINDAAKLFVGGSLLDTPMYGGAGVSNIGFKVTKSIDISDKFSLPVYGVAGFNTLSEDAFLVVGLTL